MHNYEKLIVWQKAMEIATQIYKITSQYPKEEIYGITSQMRRAAVSVPSNIAEGSKRGTPKDFRQFLRMALGSVAELETQVKLSKRLEYIKETDDLEKELAEITRMLYALITKQAH